jgi:hypothetical protein
MIGSSGRLYFTDILRSWECLTRSHLGLWYTRGTFPKWRDDGLQNEPPLSPEQTDLFSFPWQYIQIVCPHGSHIKTAADINHSSYQRLRPCPPNRLPQAPILWLISWSIDLSRFSFREPSSYLSRSIRNPRRSCESVRHRTVEWLNGLQLGDETID